MALTNLLPNDNCTLSDLNSHVLKVQLLEENRLRAVAIYFRSPSSVKQKKNTRGKLGEAFFFCFTRNGLRKINRDCSQFMTKTAGLINDLRRDCAFSWRLLRLLRIIFLHFASVSAHQHFTRISWVRTKLALNRRTDAIVRARFVAIVTSKSQKNLIDSSAENSEKSTNGIIRSKLKTV